MYFESCVFWRLRKFLKVRSVRALIWDVDYVYSYKVFMPQPPCCFSVYRKLIEEDGSGKNMKTVS